MGKLSFRTRLEPRGPAAAIVLDDAQMLAVGDGAKRFPVRAVVNGYEWQTVATRMRGENLVGLSRAVRDAAGVQIGEEVDVTLVRDDAPREVELPEALAAALAADAAAGAAFAALAPSHRREFARWVGEAKRDETRARRVEQTLQMVREGRTR